MYKFNTIIDLLEKIAPPTLQEAYDNSGIIVNANNHDVSGAIICLDVTEEVVKEAIVNQCNLIISHHPPIFKGIKSLDSRSFSSRAILLAIKHDISLYAIHTNLDNVAHGVSQTMAQRLGLIDTRVLQPTKPNLLKLAVFVPASHHRSLSAALFGAGAGNIGNYAECSFAAPGMGTFTPLPGSTPFIGETNQISQVEEIKLEVVFPNYLKQSVLTAMRSAHPYEEIAFDLIALENTPTQTGAGLVGELPEALSPNEFLLRLRKAFGTPAIKHTPFITSEVKRIAVCGGAGSFLLSNALAQGADAYVTSDIKYHEYLEAQGKIAFIDVGHYESEQYAIDLLFDKLTENFPNFAIFKTGVNTNPVQYF